MYSGKYNEVLGLTNDFLYAVLVKYMKKNLDITKPFVIAYKFYQSLGRSLINILVSITKRNGDGSTVNKHSGVDHYKPNGDGNHGCYTISHGSLRLRHHKFVFK